MRAVCLLTFVIINSFISVGYSSFRQPYFLPQKNFFFFGAKYEMHALPLLPDSFPEVNENIQSNR